MSSESESESGIDMGISGSNMNILLTRVALGVVFIVHGVGKLAGVGPAAGRDGISYRSSIGVYSRSRGPT
ncbi:MAG: DoxX family membrane protein [Halobacteria archaeon]|nr:DoxX family membrane protein [Halobacteria archaeon]